MVELSIFSTEILIAGVSVIIGGVFLKLVEKLWMSKTVVDEHATLRKELREELDAVKREIRCLQEEVDTWRERYYEQVEVTNDLSFEISLLKTKLKIYELN